METEYTIPTQPTPRQCQILRLQAKGWTQKEIAKHLNISPYTVADHLKAAHLKLGAVNTPHAVCLAAILGYI